MDRGGVLVRGGVIGVVDASRGGTTPDPAPIDPSGRGKRPQVSRAGCGSSGVVPPERRPQVRSGVWSSRQVLLALASFERRPQVRAEREPRGRLARTRCSSNLRTASGLARAQGSIARRPLLAHPSYAAPPPAIPIVYGPATVDSHRMRRPLLFARQNFTLSSPPQGQTPRNLPANRPPT
jgi:hypothetical protein